MQRPSNFYCMCVSVKIQLNQIKSSYTCSLAVIFSAVYINAAVQRFPTFVACDFLSWNYASPRRESCDGYGSTPKSQACIVQTCALRIGLVLSAVMRRKVLNKCKCPAYSYVEGTTTEMQPLCLWLVERAKPKLVFCFLAFSQAIT